MLFAIVGGGSAGAGTNPHLSMASALGACGSLPAAIVINELTSAAAVYAFSGLSPTAGSSAVSFSGNTTGLANAFALVPSLVSSSGVLATKGPCGGGNALCFTNTTAVGEQLNTLANAMTACNLSNNASGTSAVCAELFSCARANATFTASTEPCTGGTSTATTDTLSAALAVTQNAGSVSSQGIFDVANSHAAFTPALSGQPNDWTLPLIYSVMNFGPLAIDASGDVWVLSQNPTSGPSYTLSLAELSPVGFPISPTATGGYVTGGISAIDTTDTTNLAIDLAGNVWVSGNETTVAEISAAGQSVNPSGNGWPIGSGIGKTAGVAIDSSGNAWFADGDNPDVFEVSSAGVNLSGSAGFSVFDCDCNGIASDGSSGMWVITDNTGAGGYGIVHIAPGGVLGPPWNPAGTYQMQAVAADATGAFWITDQHNHGVWKFTSSGVNGSFSGLFPNNAGGGTFPKGIAVDGALHKWIVNHDISTPRTVPDSITELSANGSVNLSPDAGFGAGSITGAYSVAIDQSGNVWVGSGGTQVIEFVGAGAPTKNPIAAGITSGSLAP